MKEIRSTFGRYFEDFEVGSVIIHNPGKTITESDNNLFSLLTMNHHPVHLDRNYASHQHHKKVLVVGTLVFSVAVGLTVRDISGKAIANLAYHEVQHTGPVFIGDTIYARTKILEKRLSRSKPDRGLVKVETEVLNQNKEKVLVFSRTVLIPVKPDKE